MNSGEIDRIPVSQLIERYDLVKSAVYTRLEALGIKPERVGIRSYVNADQLRVLDDLHQFIQSGGNTAEFLESRGIQPKKNLSSGESAGLSTSPSDAMQLMSAFAAQLAARIQPPQPENTLAYFEVLEKAARNGWLLKTSEIAELLDLLPSDMKHYGDRFSEAGFTFTRAGYRAGGETAWKVSKERN